MFKKSFYLLLALVFLGLSLSACSFNPLKKKAPSDPVFVPSSPTATSTEEPSADVLAVNKFNNLEDLQKFLADNNLTEASYSKRGLAFDMGQVATPMAAGEAAMSSDSGVSNDFSQTNIQVAGVDEGDIIKSDGSYIYALVYNDLYIIKAQPASDAQIVSKLTFKSRPQNIYVKDDRLVVFGMDEQIYSTKIYETFRRRSSFAFVKVFDIADRQSPSLVRDLEFEGYYLDSRLIGDHLYFITNNYSYYDPSEPLLPRVLDRGQVIPEKCDISGNRCYAPDVYYFNIPYDSYNFTSVTAINIKDSGEAINGEVFLLNGGQNVYASAENIYITYTKYLDEYSLQQDIRRELIYSRLDQADKDRITKIEATENFILSKSEKKMKIAQIIERFISSLPDAEMKAFEDNFQARMNQKYIELAKELEQTLIYKIAIKEGQVEYKASGAVNGQILNQFSMDEYDGYFRIATTKSSRWSPFNSEVEQESYNNLYVLDENLKLISGLENLATSERIYAVRFMSKRAYMVTFRQVDPVYVIGLDDPRDPKILAALKIPGFSNYIHPYDESGQKIIGIGRETELDDKDNVIVKGIKLSLFDFSDLSKPREVSSYIIGDQYSNSIALYDHKAFLYSRAKNILSIPVSLSGEKESGLRGTTFAGALVFGAKDDKFELRAKIDHSDGGQYGSSDDWSGFRYYDNSVKRSLYINNDLFTFSNKFLMINSINVASGDFPLLKKIDFPTPTPDVGRPIPLPEPIFEGGLPSSPTLE